MHQVESEKELAGELCRRLGELDQGVKEKEGLINNSSTSLKIKREKLA